MKAHATIMTAALTLTPCGSRPAAVPTDGFAPADAYDRLHEGMTATEANKALGIEGTEIAASGPLRTLSWARRGKSGVTANFLHDRLTAKRE